ncbi:hypothetical protein [Phytohabitans aurantiacus]|uniref:Uncharacterized protein n=1 Tax=Phytohabitans aurantiacus TaxID=3016789 RepID=A0ABQ5QSA6_9ACTN|nr:hypothetical protein [Phytohabitans aurantiacus]GLH97383.1 hypothetical protein Pa4123_26580 [Phytohabitans aurantiacus]
MSDADIYLAGLIAMTVWSIVVLFIALHLARQRDLARRRYATMLALHGRQRVWIARQREQIAGYQGELDALVEATRPTPVPEDLETAVRRDLDALPVADEPAIEPPVVDEPQQPAPEPPGPHGMAIYPRRTKPKEQ